MQSLVELGFTEMEADVYLYLLQHPLATGYRVARDLGRTNANVYKAIESLQAKGAVLVDEGVNRLCRAVPATELLDQLEERFRRSRQKAERELRRLPDAPDDDRVYRLTTPDQVYERCRAMLAAAERIAIIDVFPEPVDRLRREITAAAARGVDTRVHVYQDDSIAGARVVLHRNADAVRARWNTEWVSMVVDGAQYLVAMLAPGGAGVHQAIWSASPILSWIYYSYAEADQQLSLLARLLDSAANQHEMRSARASWTKALIPEQMPAYHTLAARLGPSLQQASAAAQEEE